MFYYLNGKIAMLEQNLAVVDCGGVGYACYTTSYTISQLKIGQTAKLYTHCNIREDAFDLYGFSTREERRCFELLLTVSGVGTKAALAILSIASPDQFTLAVLTQDEKTLTMAQGVGKKMASRILLELKDKLEDKVFEASGGKAAAVAAESEENPLGSISEAVSALIALGYSKSEASEAVASCGLEDASAEDYIKAALKKLSRL